jgi:hypothetical protein
MRAVNNTRYWSPCKNPHEVLKLYSAVRYVLWQLCSFVALLAISSASSASREEIEER